MTPAELVAKLELAAKCDVPELTPAIAKKMLGAVRQLEADIRGLEYDLEEAVGILDDTGASRLRAESIACAWAFDLGREVAVRASAIVLRCPACRHEWAVEGPRSAVELASLSCDRIFCRLMTPPQRLEVV